MTFAEIHAEAIHKASELARAQNASFTNPENWDAQSLYSGSCWVQMGIREPYAKWCKANGIGRRDRAWHRGPVVWNLRMRFDAPQQICRRAAAAFVSVLADHGVVAEVGKSEDA